jgi:hypothetical protein
VEAALFAGQWCQEIAGADLKARAARPGLTPSAVTRTTASAPLRTATLDREELNFLRIILLRRSKRAAGWH